MAQSQFGNSLFKMKSMFFDRNAVLSAMDKTTRKVLSKIGAFVRTSAKSSIRKRRAISDPGSPPSSHTGILKKFIFFGYDQQQRSVVIGPTKTNQVFFDKNRRPITGTVPAALEYGGSVTIFEAKSPISGEWFRADLRSRRRHQRAPQTAGEISRQYQTRYRTAKIQPRPYMNPALVKELPKLPAMWRDAMAA